MNGQPSETLANLSKKVVSAVFFTVLLTGARLQATEPIQGIPAPQVTLAWNPVAGAAGYMFYNSFDGVNFQTPIDAGAETTISLNGLKPGTTNFFCVAAYDSNHVVGSASTALPYLVPGGMVVTPRVGAHQATAINFSAAPARRYEVQASTDLVNWATVCQTTSASNQWISYRDLQGASLQNRFYRLIGY